MRAGRVVGRRRRPPVARASGHDLREEPILRRPLSDARRGSLPATSTPTFRTAFTLHELLVFAAIVLTLAALFVSTARRARDAALHAVCLSNLGQLGQAHGLYRAEFDDFIPAITRWSATRWRTDGAPTENKSDRDVTYGWAECLSDRYLDRRGREDLAVLQCPFDGFGRPYVSGVRGPAFAAATRIGRPERRLSYARVRADGFAGSARCEDEARLASYFWPVRPGEGTCRRAADDPPCWYGCADGARFGNPSRTATLVESHENEDQVQVTWSAQVSAGRWWSLLRADWADREGAYPHWTHHRGGVAAVSTNALAGDGHALNMPVGALPHARWWMGRRPRGFPPRGGSRADHPYGWLPLR